MTTTTTAKTTTTIPFMCIYMYVYILLFVALHFRCFYGLDCNKNEFTRTHKCRTKAVQIKKERTSSLSLDDLEFFLSVSLFRTQITYNFHLYNVAVAIAIFVIAGATVAVASSISIHCYC